MRTLKSMAIIGIAVATLAVGTFTLQAQERFHLLSMASTVQANSSTNSGGINTIYNSPNATLTNTVIVLGSNITVGGVAIATAPFQGLNFGIEQSSSVVTTNNNAMPGIVDTLDFSPDGVYWQSNMITVSNAILFPSITNTSVKLYLVNNGTSVVSGVRFVRWGQHTLWPTNTVETIQQLSIMFYK